MTLAERIAKPQPEPQRKPAWLQRMQLLGLPPKDMTGKVAA